MITRERVEAVLDRVRPFMQADGGDIELRRLSAGNSADVRLTGMCAGCPSAHMTLHRRRRDGAARGDPRVRDAASAREVPP